MFLSQQNIKFFCFIIIAVLSVLSAYDRNNCVDTKEWVNYIDLTLAL